MPLVKWITKIQKNLVKSFVSMRNLYFHFTAEQCRLILRQWCPNQKEIESKNWNCRKVNHLEKSCLRFFFCKRRTKKLTWTSLLHPINSSNNVHFRFDWKYNVINTYGRTLWGLQCISGNLSISNSSWMGTLKMQN